MRRTSKPLTRNIKLIIYGIICIILVVVARLVYLQINQTDYFQKRSEKNFQRIQPIYSPRGNILDCNGKFLVTNRPTTNLYWRGTGNKPLNPAQQNTIALLETILGLPIKEDPELSIAIARHEYMRKQIKISDDLTLSQISQIEEQLPDNPNILFATHFERYYPHASHASHILGYLGGNCEPQPYGKMGLEKIVEDVLQGKPGILRTTINSVGRNVNQELISPQYDGQTIQTTLDLDIQQICERVFPHDYSGTMLIMSPEDGAIKALVSRPNFDPSIFLHPIEEETWSTLQSNHPFLNRAFNACYPPGSLFKLVTVSAMLEHNLIQPDAKIYCCGYSKFARRQYWCNKKEGHGELTLSQALAQSCNIPFYELAKHVHIDVFAKYAHAYGLGKKTNISFPEQAGLVPTAQWKREKKGEPWWPGETLSASIGQSFILVTPIQIARMIGSIFSGYLVKPRILLSEAVEKEPVAISAKTRKFLKKSMKKTVTMGSGRRLSNVKNIKVYGKTSTAQTSDLSKRDLKKEYMEHGWFVAYVKYKEQPPIVLVILAENIGSSQFSTQIAKEFLIDYKKLIDTQTDPVPATTSTV